MNYNTDCRANREQNDASARPAISGSSPIGSSAKNLQELADGATRLDGQRFGDGASRSTVETWINGLELTLAPAA